MKGVTVSGVLGPRGALEGALPSYEVRPSQLQMALAIEEALAKERPLLAEAGTGTGKTFAYLVPAVLSKKRVVISTATRNLQDQLFLKDIPLLQKQVGLQFKAAQLKGRANYLCAQRMQVFSQNPLFSSPEDAAHWPSLKSWAERTQTGDRGETTLPDAWPTWAQLSTNSDGCAGARCPHYEPCFVTQVRRRAEDVSIIVVNHALFFADLSLRMRGAEAGLSVLPPYDAVIFDEAHSLEDVATEYFGLSVSSARVGSLVQDAMKALKPGDARLSSLTPLAMAVREASDRFFQALQAQLLTGAESDTRLEKDSLDDVRGLGELVKKTLGALAAFASGDEQELMSVYRRASETQEQFAFLLAHSSAAHVYWARAEGRTVWLKAAPIDVGESLAKHLYGSVKSVIFTSATLTTATTGAAPKKSFTYVLERFGLDDKSADTLEVDSPFDFGKQAALYLPKKMPEPSSPQFVDAATECLLELVEMTQGRAFALFTSLKQMQNFHARLKHRLPCRALLQGEQSRRVLLEEFVKEPTVLFASQSFWEGVDVPGDALSLVVIDRLPFAPPNDPLTAARIEALDEAGHDAFNSYQVPQAALKLKQGFGRLIRTRKDRGIVAVLDSRLTGKRYGQAFLESLPKATRFDDLKKLGTWWRTVS